MRDFDIFVPSLAVKDQPHFANEEFKKLAIESVTEIDEEKRLGIIKKLAEIMHSEASHVFLFNREILSPHTKKITNLVTNFDTATYFWEVEKEA